ncbi:MULTISPECIES: hypothetical protein [unclassified Mycoplasma]|uniref:hypothetical protein n=1 Tax=unclassified Mycoplasma TaxID=2683645 RepID=UPI00211CD5EA|nr:MULTISPECIES: hypothetical protein [unclassified Mycoplasma]UUM19953.1 hypothetical protein NPA11_00760 [Mycoplasma sp. 1578d]UUM24934.1 hypothetical protein NPA12_00745 [Mycoplasma sp. 3686d]
MTKHEINNYLNLSKVEKGVNKIIFITTFKRKIALILLPLISALFLICTIIALIVNNTIFKIIYKYSFNIAFGNLVFIIPFLILILWILLLLERKHTQDTYAWFNKTRKISYQTFKKMIFKILWYLLIVLALGDHLIWYFVNGTYSEFEFKYTAQSAKILFESGFWNSVALSNISQFNFKHIGFIFEWIFNLFYLISFSSIITFISLFVLIGLFWFDIYHISIIKRPIRKLLKLTLKDYIQKVQTDTEIICDTPNFERYVNFLFKACKAFKIQYWNLSTREVEKLICDELEEREMDNLNFADSITETEQEEFVPESIQPIQEQETNQTNIANLPHSKLLFNTQEFEFDPDDDQTNK